MNQKPNHILHYPCPPTNPNTHGNNQTKQRNNPPSPTPSKVMLDAIELQAGIEFTVMGTKLSPSFSVGLSNPGDIILDALKDAAMDAISVGDTIVGGITSIM